MQAEIPLHFEFIVVRVSSCSGLLTGSFLVLQTGAIAKWLETKGSKDTKRSHTTPTKQNPETINGFPTDLSTVCILY